MTEPKRKRVAVRWVLKIATFAILLPACSYLFWKCFDLSRDLAQAKYELQLERESREDLAQQLNKEREEVQALKEKSRILELLGARFWGYRRFDLRKEPGASVEIGACGNLPCFVLRVAAVNILATPPTATLSIDGQGFGIYSNGKLNFAVDISLEEGARRLISGTGIDFLIAVEDTSVSNLRLGVAIRNNSHEGLLIRNATEADTR